MDGVFVEYLKVQVLNIVLIDVSYDASRYFGLEIIGFNLI